MHGTITTSTYWIRVPHWIAKLVGTYDKRSITALTDDQTKD